MEPAPASGPSGPRTGRVAALAAAVVLVSLVVYAHGWWITSPGHAFTGIHPHNDQDQMVQYSVMEQARQGRLFVADVFTVEPGQCWSGVRPLFQATGLVCRWTGWPLWASFHLARLALVVACVFLLAALARELVPASDRWLALVIVSTSSGLGWLRAEYPTWDSIDHIVKEAITFMHLHDSPLFPLSLALILGVVLCYRRSGSDGRWVLAGGLQLLLLGFEHPYDPAMLLPVLGVDALICRARGAGWRPLFSLVGMFAIASPSLLYVLVSYRLDPILAVWKANNVMPSTPPLTLVSGLGLLWPLALYGVLVRARRAAPLDARPPEGPAGASPAFEFLARWVVIQALLCYAPVDFQRRLVFGLHVPLSFLAATGLRALCADRALLVWGMVGVLSLSNVRYLRHDWVSMGRPELPYSVAADLDRVLQALREADPGTTRVVADRPLCKIVAAMSARRVVWGDDYLECVAADTRRLFDRLVAGQATLDETRALLGRKRITHLVESVTHPGPLQAAWTRLGLTAGLPVLVSGPTVRLLGLPAGWGASPQAPGSKSAPPAAASAP